MKKVSLKPNTARLKKWVAALESGRYRKYTGCLEDIDTGKVCALGVAMKVYEKETKTSLPKKAWGRYNMPQTVSSWFGLDITNPKICVVVKGEKVCDNISELNDVGAEINNQLYRMSFKKIAKGIRSTFNIK